MSGENFLWWQVLERLAAQAWSLTDAEWFDDGVPSHAAVVLSSWAGTDSHDRLATARSLQERSEAHWLPPLDVSIAIVRGWAQLRQIDYDLGRPFVDLRSDVARCVADVAINDLNTYWRDARIVCTLTVTGPGITRKVDVGAGSTKCNVRITWPELIECLADLSDDTTLEQALETEAPAAVTNGLRSLPHRIGVYDS